MKLSELRRKLREIQEVCNGKGIDPVIVFDVDARCYDVHVVHVNSVSLLDNETFGLGEDEILLTTDDHGILQPDFVKSHLAKTIEENSKDLGPEFAKVLVEKFWDLI